MPRGVKGSFDYNREIAKIDERIAKLQGDIEKLNEKKKEFRAMKEQAELKLLQSFLDEQGLSAKDILPMVQERIKSEE
jgi:predicted nuclease with TOPRIM domain